MAEIESATVITLPPVAPASPPAEPKPPRKKDNRAAARQAKKRSRNNADRDAPRSRRRKAPATAAAASPPIAPAVLPAEPSAPAPATSGSDASPRRISWSIYPLAFTTIALMGVSLTHLSEGVVQLTNCPEWQGWAMSLGIDAMLIAVALALLTATADVKRDISKVAHGLEIGTLGMSAYLNALAFTGGAFDLAHATQILFGGFIPAAISGATFILARLTRGAAA